MGVLVPKAAQEPLGRCTDHPFHTWLLAPQLCFHSFKNLAAKIQQSVLLIPNLCSAFSLGRLGVADGRAGLGRGCSASSPSGYVPWQWKAKPSVRVTSINKPALNGTANFWGAPVQVVQAWEQALLFTLPPKWSIPGNIKAWGVSMIASCERCIISAFPLSERDKPPQAPGEVRRNEGSSAPQKEVQSLCISLFQPVQGSILTVLRVPQPLFSANLVKTRK